MVEVALLIGLIAALGVVSLRAIGKNVTWAAYHAQAGLEAGGGSVYTSAWCQANGTDAICQ
jgi:hypothetical protein